MTENDVEGVALEHVADEPRQGDYLPNVAAIYLRDEAGQLLEVATPFGVLVLTQCCDLARGGNGHAHVAAVVSLNIGEAANAKSGRTPRYIPLDGSVGERLFADLGAVGGMTHAAVVAESRMPGVSPDQRNLVGDRVARRFSRFAYPDDAVPLLGWVVNKIRDKAHSTTSPLGRLLARVDRIRVELDGSWEFPPWSITLLLIVPDGELPTITEESAPSPFRVTPGSLADIAKAIADTSPGAPEAGPLWEAFCEQLATDAIQSVTPKPEFVAEFRVEVVEESELTYARFRRTSPLDVDHVSGVALD